jgi:hypothetical protein
MNRVNYSSTVPHLQEYSQTFHPSTDTHTEPDNDDLISFLLGLYQLCVKRNMLPMPESTEAEFQTKVLRVFLFAIHSHLYSFSLRFLSLQTHATSYSFCSSVTVHCTPFPMVYEIHTETSSLRTLARKPQ